VDAGGKPIPVDPEHAPTMRELMAHMAGAGLPEPLKQRPLAEANRHRKQASVDQLQ
jgi:hypothetical protein